MGCARAQTPIPGLAGSRAACRRSPRVRARSLAWYQKALAIDVGLSRTGLVAQYDVACDWALCMLTVGSETSPEPIEERRRMGDEAVAALRRAIERGWRDARHIRRDEDLDALRDREDFQRLVVDLEAAAGE